jgi:hypothetical protein
MSRFLRFLLVLVPFSFSFALTQHDLYKRVDAVQKQLNLTEWHVVLCSLSAQQMYETILLNQVLDIFE